MTDERKLIVIEGGFAYEHEMTAAHPVHGGGGDGRDLRERVSVLENEARNIGKDLDEIRKDIRELRSNFRWTWGGMAAGALAILGTLATSYLLLADQIQEILVKLPPS